MLSNIQWGSLADWFTGLITAFGIYIAIRESKLRIKMHLRIINKKLILEIHNKSSFRINLNNIYTYYYLGRLKKGPIGGPIARYDQYMPSEIEEIMVLGPHETKRYDVSVELHNYNRKYVYLKYGCEYQGGLTNEIYMRRRVKVNSYETD